LEQFLHSVARHLGAFRVYINEPIVEKKYAYSGGLSKCAEFGFAFPEYFLHPLALLYDPLLLIDQKRQKSKNKVEKGS